MSKNRVILVAALTLAFFFGVFYNTDQKKIIVKDLPEPDMRVSVECINKFKTADVVMLQRMYCLKFKKTDFPCQVDKSEVYQFLNFYCQELKRERIGL